MGFKLEQNLKYSDIWLQFEKGQCSYNFSESNPENLRKLFEIYQDEANLLIEKKLTYPALDYVLNVVIPLICLMLEV